MRAGKIRDRYDRATFALAPYQERDFPELLRPAFHRVIDARIKSRQDVTSDYAYFAFDALTPAERKQLVADLTTLYDACLFNIGRVWPEWDFMYRRVRLCRNRCGGVNRRS